MLNIINIAGRITRDPEFKQGEKHKLCRFSIACDRDFAQRGEDRKTDFVNCTAFGGTAEFIDSYFKKGDMIILSGRLQIDTDNEAKKSYTSIVVSNAYFGGSKKEKSAEPEAQFHPVDGDEGCPF